MLDSIFNECQLELYSYLSFVSPGLNFQRLSITIIFDTEHFGALAGRSSSFTQEAQLDFFTALVTTSIIEFSDQFDGTAWLNWLQKIQTWETSVVNQPNI